jgi:hypothetical protein
MVCPQSLPETRIDTIGGLNGKNVTNWPGLSRMPAFARICWNDNEYDQFCRKSRVYYKDTALGKR